METLEDLSTKLQNKSNSTGEHKFNELYIVFTTKYSHSLPLIPCSSSDVIKRAMAKAPMIPVANRELISLDSSPKDHNLLLTMEPTKQFIFFKVFPYTYTYFISYHANHGLAITPIV